MTSSAKGRMVIPFSLKLSAPKKMQKKPDPKAILKILEKVDPSKAAEKKNAEQTKSDEESEPIPVPVRTPSASVAPLEGEDEPISFSIGMARKRVSKLGKAAIVRKVEAPVVKKAESPGASKPSLLPAPIEESWMNKDVEKVDPELRPSYNVQKKSEAKKKEKSDRDSDSASEPKKSKREHKKHKSSHSKHDKESKSHSSHSKHRDKRLDSKSHSKLSKSHSESKSSKPHSDSKSNSKPPKRKFRPVHNPPPINFQDLLKMAEEKQAEGVKIVEPVIIPKKKPEERPRTQEEIDREARRNTKEYQNWLKYGGSRPSQSGLHSLSPNQSGEDSDGSAGEHEPGHGMNKSQSKFGRFAEARKPKHPPKPKVDQGKVLIDSLFSDAVQIGSNSAKKPSKPERPERPADRPVVNNSASSKNVHNSKQDGSGKFPVDTKGEKRPQEDSNSRDSNEYSKRMKASSHEHHNSHERHSGHDGHEQYVTHKHSSREHQSNPRNLSCHEHSSHKYHSSHGGHGSHKNGNYPDKKSSEQFQGVSGSSKSGSPVVMNGAKPKVMASHVKSADKSKDFQEHPVTGGKHLPQTATGSKRFPHSSSSGKGLSHPKETDNAGKVRPDLGSQGLRPPQASWSGAHPAPGGKGSSSGASRTQQSAPRIIDCSPQSPPRKAPKPSGPPPPYLNPFDRIMDNMKKNNPKPVPKPKKRRVIESDEEEDSDMDDFLASDDEEYADPSEISKAIRSVFNYDRTKYRDEDNDLRSMETSFAMQEAEERRSYRLGMKEDLEEERKEDMRKRQKMMMKGTGKKGYR